MKKLLIKQFDDKKFVFIDCITYRDEKIYHFANFEEEIFCIKSYEEYIPIKDEFKLNVIKNIYGNIYDKKIYDIKFLESLKNKKKLILKIFKEKKIYRAVDVEELSHDECQKIREDEIKNFEEVKEKLNLDIDMDKIKSIFKNIKFYNSKHSLRKNVRGYYNPVFNFIMYFNEYHKNDDITSKRVRFHENIHAITNKKCLLYLAFGSRGLVEGETENLVENIFGNEEESEWCNSSGNSNNTIKFPFSKDVAYPYNVALVRQMEFLLGEKSHKSILDGNMEFEKNFSNKYGLPLTIFLAYRSSKISIGGKNFDIIKYFDETQNILMQQVFDKEFENIDQLEDVDKFFEKLICFEKERGKIEVNGRTSDDVYITYFYEKLKAIKEKLANKGLSDEEINIKLEKYKYIEEQYESLATNNTNIRTNDTDIHPSLILVQKEKFLNSIIFKGRETVRTSKLVLLSGRIEKYFKRKNQQKEISENDVSKES